MLLACGYICGGLWVYRLWGIVDFSMGELWVYLWRLWVYLWGIVDISVGTVGISVGDCGYIYGGLWVYLCGIVMIKVIKVGRNTHCEWLHPPGVGSWTVS